MLFVLYRKQFLEKRNRIENKAGKDSDLNLKFKMINFDFLNDNKTFCNKVYEIAKLYLKKNFHLDLFVL